ncbi:hypothetical protein Tco_0759107 [Tanacetum coccineum]
MPRGFRPIKSYPGEDARVSFSTSGHAAGASDLSFLLRSLTSSVLDSECCDTSWIFEFFWEHPSKLRRGCVGFLEDFTTYCCWFNIGAASEDLVLLRKIEENRLRIQQAASDAGLFGSLKICSFLFPTVFRTTTWAKWEQDFLVRSWSQKIVPFGVSEDPFLSGSLVLGFPSISPTIVVAGVGHLSGKGGSAVIVTADAGLPSVDLS